MIRISKYVVFCLAFLFFLSCSLFFKDLNACKKKWVEAGACAEIVNRLADECKGRVQAAALKQLALEETPDLSGLATCDQEKTLGQVFCASRLPSECREL